VICHDASYHGVKIERTPAKSLGLATLTEVLNQFSARAFLDIELKVAGLEAQTVAALRAFPPQKGYVVSSFLPDVLKAIRDLDGRVPLGLLCEKRKQLTGQRWASRATGRAGTPVSPLGVAWVIPRVDLVDQALVEGVHASGKKVMVWTVNRAEEMRQLTDWGVDGIISDETELAAQVVLGS
jgi:glycerophosphoryl diester phosphodiesterase